MDDQITSASDRLKWIQFWEYFESFWCASADFMETWNIIDPDESHYDLQNRTNNALERYNRAMNDLFPTPHPSLLLFVQTIESEAREQVQRMDDIRVGRVVPLALEELTINEVPAIYTTFIV